MLNFYFSRGWHKIILLGLLFTSAGILLNFAPGFNRTAAATPEITPALDRLEKPALPANPNQADLGAVDYWFSCMVCHGDRGQGLTEEWRAVAGQEDMNCWQSRCHASNHPPEGFVLPTYAPRIIGEFALFGFETALDLYEFISAKMPWQMPGLLDDATYWQLTAFLLRENGISFDEVEMLDVHNARSIRIRPQSEDNLDLAQSLLEEDAGNLDPQPAEKVTPTTESKLGNNSIIVIVTFGAGLVLILGFVIWRVVSRESEVEDTI